MLNLTDLFPEAPTEVHFTVAAPAPAVADTEAYAAFHALAIGASFMGCRVSVDDFRPDGSAQFVATGTLTMCEALDFGALAMVRAETFGLTFSPLMVVNI